MSHIVMILDESGSMSNIRADIIKSVNEFVNEQKAIPNNNNTFTFITFSDIVKTKLFKKPLQEVPLLTSAIYNPTGSTALYKAIVDTITMFQHESNVAMVIVTDGEENSSPKNYTREQVFTLVTKHKDQNDWDFSYLSADIDTFNQGKNLGFGTTGYDVTNSTGANNTAVGYGQISSNIKQCCNVALSKTLPKSTIKLPTTPAAANTQNNSSNVNIDI